MNSLLPDTKADGKVHGRARWIMQPVTLSEGWQGLLRITSYTHRGENTKTYLVEKIRDEKGRLAGYRLTQDSGECYDIDLEFNWPGATCECADHCYRARACRHIRGLWAALRAIGEAP
jgi:hypothetical protein